MINITDMEETYCPFRDCRTTGCKVSFSREAVDARRYLHYCLSDEHDNCPLYLAEALRRSRTGASTGETLQYCRGQEHGNLA